MVVAYVMLGVKMSVLARLVACRIVASVVMVERDGEARIRRLGMCNGAIDGCFNTRSTRAEWCGHEAGNGLGVSSPEQAHSARTTPGKRGYRKMIGAAALKSYASAMQECHSVMTISIRPTIFIGPF
jgi:hypothetical protein